MVDSYTKDQAEKDFEAVKQYLLLRRPVRKQDLDPATKALLKLRVTVEDVIKHQNFEDFWKVIQTSCKGTVIVNFVPFSGSLSTSMFPP